MSKSTNPIVQEVQDRFETIYDMTTIFTNGDSATKGLLISGDAGTGKTHYVKKAIFDANAEDRCEYIKGSSPVTLGNISITSSISSYSGVSISETFPSSFTSIQ